MRHELGFSKDVRQKPAGPDAEWAEYEPTGTARAKCSCGFDTGTVPTAEAVELGRKHLDDLKTPAVRE